MAVSDRAGHVEDRWRAAFGRAVRRLQRDDGGGEAAGDVAFAGSPEEAKRALRGLCGVLWNCNDLLPADLCRDLGLPFGSSYASAAHKMRWRLFHG